MNAGRVDEAAELSRTRRSRWIRTGIFLVMVYAFAGPKLLESWRDYRHRSGVRARAQAADAGRTAEAGERQSQAPGPVMRAEVVDGRVELQEVRGAGYLLDHRTDLELSADQAGRIERMARETAGRQRELWQRRTDIERQLGEFQQGGPVDPAVLTDLAGRLSRIAEERIAVEEQSYADAVLILSEGQRRRLAGLAAETGDG